ncbi:hypothetical protein HDU87_002026 [Geranomyces variabilis]|uniref:Methyltransferase domain-containing protein n=1 Tax=Geranomyces variabilis TaxID=109894 RepID=A0AAD5XSC6_9FUNG|nr:hypothetical protein HDU87_002026 [Geranomyces variabilis]
MLVSSENYLTVQSHYAGTLAAHYSWMFGGYNARLQQNRALLAMHLPRHPTSPQEPPHPSLQQQQQQQPPSSTSASPSPSLSLLPLAIDLGCGPGFQTIPLLEAGFRVLAVDASKGMLDELDAERIALNIDPTLITAVQDDMLNFRASVADATAATVVCMGDSPTHLASLHEVKQIIDDAFAVLAPGGGTLMLQFRDLTRPLEGTDRFVPVRSDNMTVFTCFLEWEIERDAAKTPPVEPDGSGRRVKVHDLVHVKKGNSTWELCKSWYHKLAMSTDWVARALTDAGFAQVRVAEPQHGMQLVIGIKA